MHILYIFLAVGGMGAIGGIVNCAITGEFVAPKYEAGIWRPGWVGNLLIGIVAALLVWGVNGPLAAIDVFNLKQSDLHLSISQLLGSIGVGLGGGNILTQIAQKEAERTAKNTLAGEFKKSIETIKGES